MAWPSGDDCDGVSELDDPRLPSIGRPPLLLASVVPHLSAPSARSPLHARNLVSPPPEQPSTAQPDGAGDDRSSRNFTGLYYAELRRLAEWHMRGQPGGHTLQTTALAHEAYLRLSQGKEYAWDDRASFLNAAAQAMRWTLIDHARTRNARPPDDDDGAALDRVVLTYEDRVFDLLALDEALKELAADDPTMARVVELRFFAGMPMDEIASLLEISLRTLERDWAATRARLFDELS